MRVVLPGGGTVQAYGISGFISTEGHETPDWGLYLDDAWMERKMAWPHRHVSWPDFDLPTDELDAFTALKEAFDRARTGQLIDIACDGGTGRTGTALSCLAIQAGISQPDVVAWVRTNYHRYAVEVEEQERLIARFEDWVHDRRPGRS